MSMRTPLSRVRGLGSAREGVEHFWRQRMTALANIPLVIVFLIVVLANIGADYETARAFLGQPGIALVLLFVIVSGIYHMRLGMQVIIEDYVHNEGLKILSLMGNVLFSAAIAMVAAFAVLKLSLGG